LTLPYQTQTTTLELEGLEVTISYITNLDELLDALIKKGEDHEDYRDQRIPYWADLWHSAIALGRYLVREKVIQPGLSVTEIGCGLGLPGIVAGMLGAEVLLTDYLAEPLAFLKTNWEQNSKDPLRTLQMDWRQPAVDLQTDLLLASDVAYEQRFFADLEQAFKLMMRPGGRILLTEPSREMAKDFIDQLRQHPDYQLRLTTDDILWDGVTRKVNILDILVLN
jgi:predicted nicotinamide N-methyase